jgi:hypothetical protein
MVVPTYLVTLNALKPANALTVAMVDVFSPTFPLKLSSDKEMVGTGGSSFLHEVKIKDSDKRNTPANAGIFNKLFMLEKINM